MSFFCLSLLCDLKVHTFAFTSIQSHSVKFSCILFIWFLKFAFCEPIPCRGSAVPVAGAAAVICFWTRKEKMALAFKWLKAAAWQISCCILFCVDLVLGGVFTICVFVISYLIFSYYVVFYDCWWKKNISQLLPISIFLDWCNW